MRLHGLYDMAFQKHPDCIALTTDGTQELLEPDLEAQSWYVLLASALLIMQSRCWGTFMLDAVPSLLSETASEANYKHDSAANPQGKLP